MRDTAGHGTDAHPQLVGFDILVRAPQPSKHGARHAHALAMLEEVLQLADYFAAEPKDGRPVRVHRRSAPRSSNVSGSRLRPTVKVAFGLRVGYVPIGTVFNA